jgi:hypothetical protein
MSGQMSRIVVKVNEMPIPRDLFHGDYVNDPVFRARVQDWVQALWQEKDATLDAMAAQA